MTREKMEKIARENAIKDLKDFQIDIGSSPDDLDNSPLYYALDIAIKAIKTQDRLTEMLNKRITAYAEAEKSKHLNDLEYGRKTAYAHCLEMLTDD